MIGQNGKKSDKFGGLEFADVPISAEQKHEFYAWSESSYADLWQYLESLALEGYRVSVKYDFNNRCFQASMTQQDKKHVNGGKCMITRASDTAELLLLTIWKHIVLCHEDEWPIDGDGYNWG